MEHFTSLKAFVIEYCHTYYREPWIKHLRTVRHIDVLVAMILPPGSAAVEAGFPVRTRTYAREIDGEKTDFFVSIYQDQAILVVTQLGW